MVIKLSFLKQIAAVAAEQTLPRFRTISLIDNKYQTGFDPVTEADREAEKAIRKLINASFPDHGILGEEFGGENLDHSHVWVIDPIDGTRAFISGIPVWGTLAGLTIDGDAVAGLMAQPFTNELFMCDGDASWYEGPGGIRRLETRKTTELSEATLFTTTPAMFKDEKRAAYDRVEQSVRLARYGTDCYAYSMLAAGFVDLVVETGLHPYDIVALVPIIEKAGGVITTWDGGPAEKAGDIVAAATPELHAKTLELLNR
ncbi:histidinol-phosphatase [Phyllobacterium bourgognense]|uniref:Histidinol-phosphatase n=1 Tax=Phyllobacterium bourgognense TaxID=314236 RepID=A0A368YRY4_9HYPH|nr:histidinol-phosphatase [Phyllobacterium bourgognense]RCW82981.1 histidinol phosphatase-like enzyme (inositol monophosphatase family) [Phyllobacterium bourgognense]